MNVNSFSCEFDGSPKDFKELIELLKPYKKYDNIKDILRDIHSDKRKNTCNIEHQNCLLTSLNGYKDWLGRQDPPDTDYSIFHCIELSNPPNSNFLFSPVFSTPKMTSKYLKQQASQLFYETFPGLDFNECMKGNVDITNVITPTMEEFEKNFEFKNDPQNINKHAAFLSYYRYCVNLQFEELQNIVFILRLSKLLEMYDHQVISSGVQSCTFKRNSKRTKRKNRTYGGGPDDLISSSTWLSWLQTTFKVDTGIVATAGIAGFICSDLIPNVCFETVKDSYVPVVAGLCSALTTMVALNTQPFSLERKRHFSSTHRIQRRQTEGNKLVTFQTRKWYSMFLSNDRDQDGEQVLTPVEINNLLQNLVGHIMHTSVAQTSDIDKFKLLLHEKLTLHYQSGYELAVEQATEMMKARKIVEQMSQQELDDYKDGMAVASINDLARRAVVSQGEIDSYQQKIRLRFTQIIVDSILTKITDEINLAKEGVRLSPGFYREKNAEIRQKTKDDKLASTMGYIMASAVIRECTRGNLIDRGFVTEKVFNNTVLTAMISIGMFAMKQLGAPPLVLGAGFIGLMYSLTKLLSSGSEDQMHAWHQIANSDENSSVSTDGMSIEDREIIAQEIFKNATAFYNKTITTAEKESTSGWSITSVSSPSAWISPIKIGYWNTRWYFSNLWHHPLMSSLYYEKMYKSSGELGKYLGGGLALVSLAFAGNALCTSYTDHRNAVVIAKEDLETKMAPYTFQLKRLQDLLEEEGGTPFALQHLMEKEHDIMKVVRDMSQIKTTHQLALATSIQAVTAGEDIRVKERQVDLNRQQLRISTEMLGLKQAKSSTIISLVDRLTEHIQQTSQQQTTAIEKITEQMSHQSSLQETISAFSTESLKSQQKQNSELVGLFKELQQTSITSQEGQTETIVSGIDKLVHQFVSSKEDHKEDLGELVQALVGSKTQDKELFTSLIQQLAENGQRNTEDLRSTIAHTERFCMATDGGLADSINTLHKQVGQVVELFGSKEFKTTISDDLEVPTRPIIFKSKLSSEEVMKDLETRLQSLMGTESKLELREPIGVLDYQPDFSEFESVYQPQQVPPSPVKDAEEVDQLGDATAVGSRSGIDAELDDDQLYDQLQGDLELDDDQLYDQLQGDLELEGDQSDSLGDQLEGDVEPIGNQIESDVESIGDQLESDIEPIGDQLESDAEPIGNQIEGDAEPIGNQIESDTDSLGDQLETDSLGDQLESDADSLGDQSETESIGDQSENETPVSAPTPIPASAPIFPEIPQNTPVLPALAPVTAPVTAPVATPSPVAVPVLSGGTRTYQQYRQQRTKKYRH